MELSLGGHACKLNRTLAHRSLQPVAARAGRASVLEAGGSWRMRRGTLVQSAAIHKYMVRMMIQSQNSCKTAHSATSRGI
ncbi:MAG: hypothetical protein WBN94_00130, partial [Methanothrix sp.]